MAMSTASLFSSAPFSSPRNRPCCRARAVTDWDSVETVGSGIGKVNGAVIETKKSPRDDHVEKRKNLPLPVLYDDGFGNTSVKDYLDCSKNIMKPDGGPPRWFCPVECGAPVTDAPLLLFLPGLDGTGYGLILHHKPLGKFFEVRCLHIPINDRTSFEGLVTFVERTVQYEHAMLPNKPIYLVGDSLGGCLALAVAARNPSIDLVLVLANPATSFGKSQLQPLLPILEAIPEEFHITVPYMLSFIMGNPIKLAMASIANGLSPSDTLDQLSQTLTALLPRLSDLADILPKEALKWKIKLAQSAALYVNSRLHAVNAEVLLLTSGKDNMLPSQDEGQRLLSSLKNCRVRHFKDNGHTLLMEDSISLMTIIKALSLYRRSRKHDYVKDFLPPSLVEYKKTFEQDYRWFRVATDPVMLSTLKNGEIVRGLSGVPDKGPILLVGYHMLMGLELSQLYEGFLREKKVCLRGLAHPLLFSRKYETSRQEVSVNDFMKVFGAIPVTPLTMYKLFSQNEFVLLYPGGAREALHPKGEGYKLFWPDQPEFVRMAANMNATIVPFGAVGEDDIAELVLDYNDLKGIPMIREAIRDMNKESAGFRSDVIINGEVPDQDIFIPALLPKIPGRFYYLFGKSIETKGMKETLRERENANLLYLQVKSEVERILSYLKKKREEDPYRGIVQRTVYQASWSSKESVPTFDP